MSPKISKVLYPESNLKDLFKVLTELLKSPPDPDFKPFKTQYPGCSHESYIKDKEINNEP